MSFLHGLYGILLHLHHTAFPAPSNTATRLPPGSASAACLHDASPSSYGTQHCSCSSSSRTSVEYGTLPTRKLLRLVIVTRGSRSPLCLPWSHVACADFLVPFCRDAASRQSGGPISLNPPPLPKRNTPGLRGLVPASSKTLLCIRCVVVLTVPPFALGGLFYPRLDWASPMILRSLVCEPLRIY